MPPSPDAAAGLPARYYLRLVELVGELGVSASVLRDASGLPDTDLGREQARLSLVEVERLCGAALGLSGRPDLGLQLGAAIEPAHHASLGLAMLRCATLDDALRLASRYFSLLSPGFRLRYTPAPSYSEVWIFPQLPFSSATLRLHLDAVLVAFINELRFLHGADLPALKIALSGPRPSYAARYRALLRDRIEFAAEQLPGIRVLLPTLLLLQARAPQEDPSCTAARQRCEQQLQRVRQHEQIPEWTRMMLREAQHSPPTQPELAALLDLSSRSLARHLATQGCSFRQLQRQTRLALAELQLADADIPITDIALRLGYRDLANFSRAFRRDGGQSPRSFRVRARGRKH